MHIEGSYEFEFQRESNSFRSTDDLYEAHESKKGIAHQLQCTISEGRYQARSSLVHSLCALCASVVNPPTALGLSGQIYMTKFELLLCTRCLRLNFNRVRYTT